MTENKRFILDDDGIVTDTVDLSMYIDNEDCCEKLNELAEENKELKEFKQQLITLIDNNIEKLNNTDTVSLIPKESIMVLERLKKVYE